ncbi:Prophage tail fiber protein [plant metagenome]|uniref:Prophage tail fiber protein n=1 Tax=plant metagenome TaxID=1297885 RepID=A0A484TXC9_9ZZZZ
MAENQLLPFGGAAGANVLTPAEYAALGARAGGFQAGVAKSREVNTVLRQAAFAAAMIGQFSADRSGEDVQDDGDVAAFQAAFTRALLAVIDGRAVPYVNRADLPSADQGPLFVIEASEIWTWSQSAFFTGYRSPLCGRVEHGWTAAPQAWQADAVGGLYPKADPLYAGLWGYAREMGMAVPVAQWTAGTGYYADVNASSFRVPDLRNQFLRFNGNDAETGGVRAMGHRQSDAVQNIHGQFSARPYNAQDAGVIPDASGAFQMLRAAGTSGASPVVLGTGDFRLDIVAFAASRVVRTSVETRPVNTTYAPRVHL